MSEIFLSYKSEDRPRARIIAEALERHGYSVWWDRKILPGKTFDQVIEEALDAAECVIVLWSQQSVLSDWVKEEANEGITRRILVPVLIDDVKIPLGFRRIQAARLIDWQGKLPEPDFDLLLESVSKILGGRIDVEKEEKEVQEESERKVAEAIRKTYTNSIGMKFILIPSGEFVMGAEGSDPFSKPLHKVRINKPFYLGIYPVTQREWKAVMKKTPPVFKGDDMPMERVSWSEAQKFIEKLNRNEGTNKYRLPTEAEWKYAARAGTTTKYFFGDDESKLGDYAWYAENSGSRPPKRADDDVDSILNRIKDYSDNKWEGKTHPVGQKKPNPWGLYDIYGNVWEWVQDTWHKDYNGAPDDGSARIGAGSHRVCRGGGWESEAWACESAYRQSDIASDFRLLREI